MDRPAVPRDPVERARRRAATASASASRAAKAAQRLERRAATADAALSVVLLGIAARQRESEWRFRSVAAVHHRHADRLRSAPGRGAFIAAVADCLHQPSTAIALLGAERDILAGAASDATARAAHLLELTLGEGPVHDLATDPALAVAIPLVVDAELTERWPLYGPGLGYLGVRAVVAAPLQLTGSCVGALVAFSPSPAVPAGAVGRVHDLACGIMDAAGTGTDAIGMLDSLGIAPLLDEADIHPVVHQAAGMISVQLDVGIDDAYPILRARAFADGEDLHTLAARVVRSGIRFT